jgi:hypothetical protein
MNRAVLVLFALVAMNLISPSAQALEAQDPATLCDRFVAEADQKNCEKKIKEISPDWYLASACSHQFDDALFYSCLESGHKATFAPPALEKCSAEDLSDEARLICVKSAQTDVKKSFQNRAPASRKIHSKAEVKSKTRNK